MAVTTENPLRFSASAREQVFFSAVSTQPPAVLSESAKGPAIPIFTPFFKGRTSSFFKRTMDCLAA